MSFGTGPFALGPLGLPIPTLPSENDGQIVTSRKIDGRGAYTQTPDGTGAFQGMSDVQQRVVLLLAYRVNMPDKFTAGFADDVDTQIRTALEPLTRGSAPKIEILQVVVTDSGSNISYVDVQYRDLTSGGIHSAPAKIR